MREKILLIFPFKANVFKTKEEKPEELKKYINNTFTFIERKSGNINNDLFKIHFNFSAPIDLAKKTYSKKTINRKTVSL